MTKEQNRYYRACVVRKIAQALNKSEDETHMYLKSKFIHLEYLPDECMTKYISDASLWAAEHGIELEEPNAPSNK